MLATYLYNLVQPIIRLEISDAITIESEPCSCGRTLARARAIEGRTDDVLKFVGHNGGEVSVHPIEFGVVTRDRAVREFQVVQEGSGVRILVVPRPTVGAELEARLREAVSRRLSELGWPNRGSPWSGAKA